MTAPGSSLLNAVSTGDLLNPTTGAVGAQGLAAPTPLTLDNFTNAGWAVLVLAFLGAPITQNNIDNFTTWMTGENAAVTWTGTAGANNPLNNGLGSGGGDGTGSYPDLVTAAYYAAKGVEGGIGGAAPIGAALMANAPFSVFHAATVSSGWAGSHYAGSIYGGLTSAAPPPAVTASAASAAAVNEGANAATLGDYGTSVAAALGPNAAPGLLAQIVNAITGGAAGTAADLGAGAAAAAKPLTAVVAVEEELLSVLGHVTSVAFWQRLGMGLLGIGLFAVGLAGFISTTAPGQKATSDAGTAVKSAASDAAVVAVAA